MPILERIYTLHAPLAVQEGQDRSVGSVARFWKWDFAQKDRPWVAKCSPKPVPSAGNRSDKAAICQTLTYYLPLSHPFSKDEKPFLSKTGENQVGKFLMSSGGHISLSQLGSPPRGLSSVRYKSYTKAFDWWQNGSSGGFPLGNREQTVKPAWLMELTVEDAESLEI